MAYDKNTDYMAIMNAAKASGDMAAYIDAENKREEKLHDMNAAGTNTQGYTSTRTQSGANAVPTDFKGSTKASGAVSPAAQKIIDQMNTNSLKWYTDPANKATYEQANQQLSQQLAQLTEADQFGGVTTYTPKYNSAAGTWNVVSNYEGGSQQQQQQQQQQQVGTNTPTLAGLELGDKYGIDYNRDVIKKLLDDATKAQYGLRNQQQTQSENKFYNNMLDTQGTALDTLRKTQASAVATGASRGMAAANELSAILNLQQLSSDEATLLAEERGNLGAEEAAAYTKNASDALTTSNTLKQAIAGLDSTKYGYDTQGYAAILSYLAALADVAAQKYSSDSTLAGVKYNADANVAAAGKTYGTSGRAYTGGNSGTGSGTKTNTSGALDDLNTKIAANNGWSPDGYKYTITNNGDGTYTLRNVTDVDGTTGNLTVDETEMEKIKNNGYDPTSVTDPTYGTETVKSNYDVGSVTNTKGWTEQQALDYMHATGRLAPGWYVDPAAGPKYATFATYVGESKTNNYTITGTTGQKISVGIGNYATTWTYNAKTGLWSNSSGGSKNMNDFKTYVKGQNQAYVKALN